MASRARKTPPKLNKSFKNPIDGEKYEIITLRSVRRNSRIYRGFIDIQQNIFKKHARGIPKMISHVKDGNPVEHKKDFTEAKGYILIHHINGDKKAVGGFLLDIKKKEGERGEFNIYLLFNVAISDEPDESDPLLTKYQGKRLSSILNDFVKSLLGPDDICLTEIDLEGDADKIERLRASYASRGFIIHEQLDGIDIRTNRTTLRHNPWENIKYRNNQLKLKAPDYYHKEKRRSNRGR